MSLNLDRFSMHNQPIRKIAERNRMFFIIVRLLHFSEDKERIIGLELILIETDLIKNPTN